MAPEDSTGPGVCNDADYFWYNWQPFSNPQPEMFIPLPPELTNTAANFNCRNGNVGTFNSWFLPIPFEEDARNFFLHYGGGEFLVLLQPYVNYLHLLITCTLADWHSLAYLGEEVSQPPAEVPQLEDFFSASRPSPPPPSCAATPSCYEEEQEIFAGILPGKASSEEDDFKSDHLSQPDANLANALPLVSAAFPPAGDVAEDGGKSRCTALVGTTGQRSSSYRGVTRQVPPLPYDFYELVYFLLIFFCMGVGDTFL